MKSNIKVILSMTAGLLAILSCSKMNDLHEPYLMQGEIVYAAKVDSVKSYVAVNSQVLDIYAPSRRIVRGVIKWNLGQDSLEFTLPQNLENPYRVIVDGLEEGNYTYEIYGYDSFGNKSLTYELTSNVVSQESMNMHIQMMTKSIYYSAYDECVKEVMQMCKAAKISNAQNFGGNAWFMFDNGPFPGAKVHLKYFSKTEQKWKVHVYDGATISPGNWVNNLTDALVEPKDTQKFYYSTHYENLNFKRTITQKIDLGEEYAVRWYEYKTDIVINEFTTPEVEDIW